MKKKLIYLFILSLVIILQTSIVPVFFSAWHIGDGVLMAVLAWSLLDGFGAFRSWAIFAGLFYDLLSYTTVGTHALIFLLVVWAVSFFSRRITIELKGSGLILFFLFIVISTLLSRFIVSAELALQLQGSYSYLKAFGTFGQLCWQIVYNVIAFTFWLWFIKKNKEFFQLEN